MNKLALFLLCLFSSAAFASIKALPADPTKPKVWLKGVSGESNNESTTTTRWKLQAVSIGEGSKSAVISGKVVSEGQSLRSDVTVESIEPRKVVINNQGSLQTLKMKYLKIKQELDNNNEN